jgi:DNA-binding NtrC family response regulator
VRELRGAVERAILLGDLADASDDLATTAERGVLGSAAIPEQDFASSFRAAKERAVGAWERAYLIELCRRNQGNLSKAARAARMDRNHLRELLKRYGLSAEGQ